MAETPTGPGTAGPDMPEADPGQGFSVAGPMSLDLHVPYAFQEQATQSPPLLSPPVPKTPPNASPPEWYVRRRLALAAITASVAGSP
jgi:hypothetical protein